MVLVPLQVTTAVLSITAKAKARAKKSEASEDKMEVVRFVFFITSKFGINIAIIVHYRESVWQRMKSVFKSCSFWLGSKNRKTSVNLPGLAKIIDCLLDCASDILALFI